MQYEPLTIRAARIVPVGRPAPSGPIDLRIRDGHVSEIGPALADDGSREIDVAGRWLIPGLWDHHVHMTQWAHTLSRLDVSGSSSPGDVLRIVRSHDRASTDRHSTIVGFGYRSAGWASAPTVRDLDEAVPDRPVVLISGDAHNGWLNSTALRLLDLPLRDTPISENAWFDVFPLLAALPGAEPDPVHAYRTVLQDAAGKGVVGITDMEFESSVATWGRMVPLGLDTLRVRASTYLYGLEATIAAGLRTGDPLPGGGAVATMGPLKIIADGSLGTMTALCCAPYAGHDTRGTCNVSPEELLEALRSARAHGLDAAVHAIGDAAATMVLDAFRDSGIRGSIEHAQLLDPADITRMATLGVRASVQPAQLYDDRDLSEQLWPGCADRSFMLRSMVDAGVQLALGSDAPVAPLDPWLAMAAAVHRSADSRGPWGAAQAITPAEALCASTDGQQTPTVGSRADLVLLDADPLAVAHDSATAAHTLRTMGVAATLVGGRVVHDAL
ncbi:amidohydrolase [Allobranchiibius sp. CTAmp26]|uniref:amidohydrolase n=1 Tax=Allobranchiibius sp. CTAmp26 TaxID=2815214 RepID=UPI001AA10BC2|nr:amidohydrolase family protein [Allobranchiibius sp. CTAmp26]MBO1755271.1 amidohydrolase family protein [Allobranchiibius sp. CTAmp26]